MDLWNILVVLLLVFFAVGIGLFAEVFPKWRREHRRLKEEARHD